MFKDLPAPALADLARGASLVEYLDGSTVFSQGDPAEHVYAVVGGPGRVRIGSADDNGKTLMVEVFSRGEVFGELGVLDGGNRSADAVAEGGLILLRVRAAVFLHALATVPGLGLWLCRSLSNRLRRTFSLLEATTFETVEVRLARQLRYLGEKQGRRVPGGLRLAGRYRQGDLADLLGVTARSIITVLNGWRQSGAIEYDAATGRITILDGGALGELIKPRS